MQVGGALDNGVVDVGGSSSGGAIVAVVKIVTVALVISQQCRC